MALSWLSFVLMIAALVSGISAVSASGRRYIPGNRSYTAFMVGLVIWLGGYALEISSIDFTTKLLWAKIQYLGIPFITPLFVLFMAQYVGSRWLRHRWLILACFIVPTITAILIWLRTEWIWSKVIEEAASGGAALTFEYGGWFYINVIYSYLSLLVGMTFLLEIAIRSPRLAPWQSRLLIFGVAVPFFTNVGYVFGLIPLKGLDLTPLSLATLGLSAAITMFEMRLLDVMPVIYRAALESVPEGVVMIDQNGRVKTVNPEAARYLGRPAVQLYGRIAEKVLPQRWCELLDSAEPTQKITLEIEEEPNDTFVDFRAVPVFDSRNRFIGRMLLFRDITIRKRAQIALAQREANLAKRVAERTAELEATNAELVRVARLKDEFLAGMSHELRTPLNAVIGTAEALREEVYGSVSAQQTKSLSRIEDSAYHLLELINDILDVSKVAADALELEVAPTAIETVCHASLNLVRNAANKKRLNISVKFDVKRTVIMVDERRLRQILTNLLSNAVKFTPAGGSFGIKVVEDAQQYETRFMVWDTGIGIADSDHTRLFKPFVQLDASLARRHEGTGLGLALSKQLAELHGGDIEVVSRLGTGSLFTVVIPWLNESRRGMPLIQNGAMKQLIL